MNDRNEDDIPQQLAPETPLRTAFEAWWAAEMNTELMPLDRWDCWDGSPKHRRTGGWYMSYSCGDTGRAWLAWQESARQAGELK